MQASRIPIPSREERAQTALAAERQASRDELWLMLRTLLLCALWSAIGIYCIGWSLHTSSKALGRIAFWGGILVGNAGILGTLIHTWRTSEDRGLA
jgi:hypothetical protein